MSMAATDIKGMITIKIKPRHDGHTDQYNRIFMVKLLMISSLIMGISWFQDSIHCIVPDSHKISGGFVSATCWIQGVYVYKELQDKVDKVAYYGIPKNMDNDGMLSGTEDLCTTSPKLSARPNPNCRPMTKTFYLQYQWMPFLVAALAILYYLPYVAFTTANQDLISLRKEVKKDDVDPDKITKYYFNHRTNPPKAMALRVLANILVKVLYFAANLVTLLGLNNLLNDEFISYGSKWAKWSSLDNHIAFDYMGMRDFPKPGNQLLPPFGYCEMYESARDVKHTLANKHKFVCELSQNILYQYVLVVLWFAIVFGIVISSVGLVLLIIHYAIGMFGIKFYGRTNRKIFKSLSFREIEYLEFIQRKNVVLYQEILEKLRETFVGPNAPNMDDEYALRDNVDDKHPLYPSLPPKERFEHA